MKTTDYIKELTFDATVDSGNGQVGLPKFNSSDQVLSEQIFSQAKHYSYSWTHSW